MTIATDTVLDKLVEGVREDIASDKRRRSEADINSMAKDAPPTLDFAGALRRPDSGEDTGGGLMRVIAEVKQASPSQGRIAERFEPARIAAAYEEGGAAAVSVLTERRRFLGEMAHLEQVRAAVGLPVLRKEFIFTEYQILEARAGGADAVLLIAAILETTQMEDLRALAEELEMDALVEVYAEEELGRALEAGTRVLGVNNRNSRPSRSIRSIPPRCSSSSRLRREKRSCWFLRAGFSGGEEVAPLVDEGVDAILVGEALMRAPDTGELLRELKGLHRE